MSWAVPEVRRHTIDLLREMVRLAPTARISCSCAACRSCSTSRHSGNCSRRSTVRTPAPWTTCDPKILATRSDVVTTFFRELRAMLDEEQKRRGDGKRLEASVITFGNPYDNSWYGIDIPRLVNAGLLDHIMVYPFDMGTRKGGVDYASLREICGPKGVPWRVAGAFDTPKMLKYAVDAYDGGALGISIFDGVGRDIDDWLPLSRMGHEAEVRELVKSEPRKSKYYFFHLLGTKVMDGRFTAVWGG